MQYYLGTTHANTDITKDDVIDILITLENKILFTDISEAAAYAAQQKHNRQAFNEFVMLYTLDGPHEKLLSAQKQTLIVDGCKTYGYQVDLVDEFIFINCVANISAGKIFYLDIPIKKSNHSINANRESAPIIPFKPLYDIL